jgi:predicted DNA-binding WGR domain protein
MEKLYRNNGAGTIEYWEAWESETECYIVHWGELGTTGTSKQVNSGFLKSAEKKVQAEIANKRSEGFAPISPDDHVVLVIEYAVDGFGTPHDLEKLHALEGRMNELLGWTGLGSCDGSSIGSDSMEVANFVVDYGAAESVIRGDLTGTEFGDFARIYAE